MAQDDFGSFSVIMIRMQRKKRGLKSRSVSTPEADSLLSACITKWSPPLEGESIRLMSGFPVKVTVSVFIIILIII